MRSPSTSMKSSSRSPRLEEGPCSKEGPCSDEDPAQPNKQNSIYLLPRFTLHFAHFFIVTVFS